MEKTFQKDEAERQRPEGGSCLGLSKEIQKPKVCNVAFGRKVNSGEKPGRPDTKSSLPAELRGKSLSWRSGESWKLSQQETEWLDGFKDPS